MKKTVLTTAILCLFALCDVQAQIDNRYHWYDGTITYTATHLEHSNVKMYGMDEGEEHEFVLRYTKEVNPEHQLYSVIDDNLGFYNTGLTAHHQKAEGLDVICIYDSNDLLKTVMSGETEWNIEFTMENMSVDHIIYPFEIICFNGRATGFIRVEEVPGALNELQGMWKIEPTLEGLHMYSVNTETGNSPWDWEADGKEFNLKRTDLQSGRFDYASRILLNDKQFRHFDKKTLRIMRNEILARHGYRFKSKDLQEYFGKQSWYKPVSNNSKVKLSFLELLNVELIKYEEAQKQ